MVAAEAEDTTGVVTPLPILLVSIAPVVVTVETVFMTGEILSLPSDALVGGKGTPAEVVKRGLKELELELVLGFTGIVGAAAEFELGPGLCCSGPDMFSIWLRWGVIA